MKTLAICTFALLTALVAAQSHDKVIRRIRVLHADPMLIARLIAENHGVIDFTLPPEISTVIKSGTTTGGNGGFGNSGFGGGRRG